MKQPEVWMRGPIEGIPALLQPVAHTLLQAQEEIHALMENFPEALLWQQPAGVASAGFHLQHITGVLDRLFTYAAGQALSVAQLSYLAEEVTPATGVTVHSLLTALDTQVAAAIATLKVTDESCLTDFRGVGRKQLPSTVMGLLFHAAEHTMRHTGQLLVTVKILVNP
ncbi:DinB family protein [Chitinophaga ginsengisoli]|uniref:DinB family protein n=1 Tax=Chitinophaga ginsengisoli TaxID=363837 RepID=A0A2P8GHG5_9BACT|nr:DinB family protein [Chitinophaga ginsengisoli]PSL33380.1 DinB family protein [Chitinophaga ginsengisoli]